MRIGATQYLILAAGYDTFAYRQPDFAKQIQLFEIDQSVTLKDKQERLKRANIYITQNTSYIEADFTVKGWQKALSQHQGQGQAFDSGKISFCSMLGLVYYLSKQSFNDLLSALISIIPRGSSIVFDYPDEDSYTDKAGERAKKQAMLAGAANEKMLASYSYEEIEALLAKHGFLIYEHLNPREITEQYFSIYNQHNPSHQMTAFDNVNYCLAILR